MKNAWWLWYRHFKGITSFSFFTTIIISHQLKSILRCLEAAGFSSWYNSLQDQPKDQWQKSQLPLTEPCSCSKTSLNALSNPSCRKAGGLETTSPYHWNASMDPILHPTKDVSTFTYLTSTHPAEGLRLGKTHTVHIVQRSRFSP